MKDKIKNLIEKVKSKKEFVVLDKKNYNELMKQIKFIGDREKF